MTEDEANARYHSPMRTDAQMGESWMALKREMEINRYMKRTGLRRDEVTVVVNHRTGKAYPQWVGAIPKEMETRRAGVK